jgi:predicted DNA-binding transcriptional regulator YafY
MPKTKSAAIRYRIIDQLLNSKKHRFPSLADIAHKCSDVLGVDISTSTIEKDIAEMRKPAPKGYSAPIVYSKAEGGYVYGEIGFSIAELNLEEEEWASLQFAAQLLYQYKDVPVFAHFKSAIERINTRFSLGIDGNDALLDELVQFEKSVDTKGMEWIETIYTAIKEKRSIDFTYRNIYKDKENKTMLIPYLLKEHRNRWYVIGWSEEKEKYTTYALDRISNLSTQAKASKRRSDFNAASFFQFSTGITESNTKPEEILLTIKKPISDLVLLEPLHHSQKIIQEKIDSIQICLHVLINQEFILQLLGMGSHCIVEKPAKLRKQIKSVIQDMQINYL